MPPGGPAYPGRGRGALSVGQSSPDQALLLLVIRGRFRVFLFFTVGHGLRRAILIFRFTRLGCLRPHDYPRPPGTGEEAFGRPLLAVVGRGVGLDFKFEKNKRSR